MRRLLILAVLAASVAGARVVSVQHNAPAAEAACAGNRDGGKCDVIWVTYSVESLGADKTKVNCPKGSSAARECYAGYEDSKGTSTGWGTPATTALVPKTPAGPVEIGGVSYGTGPADARAWTGAKVQGAGAGSVAVGGGRNASNDPFACVTLYGGDETDGHRISAGLNDAGIADDRSDYDTDAQFCGEFFRGLV